MAVYLVSVKRFAGARRSFATGAGRKPVAPEQLLPPPVDISLDSPVLPVPEGKPAPARDLQAQGVEPAPVSAIAREARAELQSKLAASVEELLHLPRAQVGTLLAECGETTSKVLLALIYRLAAVEGELNDLAAKVRGGVRALQSAVMSAPSPRGAPLDKSEVLEQLFHKNLSLRQSR